MGYTPNNNYILENDVDEINNKSFQKEMKRPGDLPEGYEIEEAPQKKTVQQELQEAAEAENLIAKEDYLGGEGASHEEVIDALINEEMSDGAKANKEQYEKDKVENFITVTATRDLLMNKAKKTIPIYIKTSAWILNPETGKEELQKTKMKFIIKRLTESENTHLLNHKLIGKELADMTEEEYIQSSHFRSQLLEASVVEPYFTAEEWRTLVDNGTVTALYDEVNKILTSADDSALFQ